MIPSERRAAPRLQVPSGYYASHADGHGPIRDLSTGGVFIEDVEPLLVGTKLVVSLHLDEDVFSFRGVVRRSIPNVGMGIQFLSAPRDAKARLERYLRALVAD